MKFCDHHHHLQSSCHTDAAVVRPVLHKVLYCRWTQGMMGYVLQGKPRIIVMESMPLCNVDQESDGTGVRVGKGLEGAAVVLLCFSKFSAFD